MEIDENSSRNLSDPQLMTDTFYGGYKTVEEIYAYLDQKVAQSPTLVEKIDIGDSWCKCTPARALSRAPGMATTSLCSTSRTATYRVLNRYSGPTAISTPAKSLLRKS